MLGLSERATKLALGLAAGLAGGLLALGVWSAGLLELWEGKSWDYRVRKMAAPAPSTEQIKLIFLDQASLDWGKKENGLSWPWPREIYAAITQFCARGGAKALAFDVLFTEHSKYGVGDDQAFAAALKAANNTTLAFFLTRSTGGELAWPEGTPKSTLPIEGLEAWLAQARTPPVYPRASFPIPDLGKDARFLGNVNFDQAADGVYRFARPFSVYNDAPVPSLGMAAYLTANKVEHFSLAPNTLTMDALSIPLDEQGGAVLNFRGPSGTHQAFSAAAVLQSEIKILSGETPTLDPAVFKDSYVLLGFTAPGLFDLRPTPVSGSYPGVEVHATMLDNMLGHDFMRRTPKWFDISLSMLLALAAGIIACRTLSALRLAGWFAVFLVLPGGLATAAYHWGWWAPFMFPELGAAFGFALGGITGYAFEGREKRFIRKAFAQYLSPEVVKQLVEQPDRLQLGGERRELTIFFSDLEGFTGISQRLAPEELTSLLNDYLTAMTDIILDHGGTVDKYEGDAIIAFWNAPLKQYDHARRGVQAALECQQKLDELQHTFMDRAGRELRMRIGMNSGAAVVGNMGSQTRFDYSMLGDAVNLAARLEGANKAFGSRTMVSHDTLESMGDSLGREIPARELGRIAVMGRSEPVVVYELLLEHEFEALKPSLGLYAAGLLAFYNGDFELALERLQDLAESDYAARAYVEKCRKYRKNPPEDWAGVWVMESK